MRFLLIVLSDVLVLTALGFAGWTLYRQVAARRIRAMCPRCQAAVQATDDACPGCGQAHAKPLERIVS